VAEQLSASQARQRSTDLASSQLFYLLPFTFHQSPFTFSLFPLREIFLRLYSRPFAFPIRIHSRSFFAFLEFFLDRHSPAVAERRLLRLFRLNISDPCPIRVYLCSSAVGLFPSRPFAVPIRVDSRLLLHAFDREAFDILR
jgi:hypothetical protein